MKRFFTILVAVGILLTLMVSKTNATTNRSITLDGSNDFDNSTENLGVESDLTGYLTWDENNLYIGIEGNPLIGKNSNLYVVVDTTPVSNNDPRTGGGRTDQPTNDSGGATYPFGAETVFLFYGAASEDSVVQNPAPGLKYTINSGDWASAAIASGVRVIRKSNSITELEIPFTELGISVESDFNILFYIVNNSSGGDNFAQWPRGNANGNNPTLKDFYTYTRTSNVTPNAGEHYSYREDSTTSYAIGGATFGSIFFVPGSATTYNAGALTKLGYHLYVGPNATFSMGTNTAALSVSKDVTIAGTLSLSSNISGDLNVGGDFTNSGTFTANSRAVTFNGTTQEIKGSATTPFAYLTIASGSSTTLAQNANVANEININGTLSIGSNTLTLQNGVDLKINSGGTLTSGTGTIILEGTGSDNPNFINNGTFNRGTGTIHFKGGNNIHGRVWGGQATSFYNITIECITLNSNACGTAVPGVFGVDFYDQQNDKRATIYGTLHLSNMGTFIATHEAGGSGGGCSSGNCDGRPIYANESTLRYSTGHLSSSPFYSAAEWWPNNDCSSLSTNHGMPHHVVIDNNTYLNINAAFDNGGFDPRYSSTGSNKTACGNITITSGGLQSTAGTLAVKGNWTNNGTFTSNDGTVTFNGPSTQTIGGSATTNFHNLTLDNSAGARLGRAQTVANQLTLTSGRLTLGGYNLTLGSSAPTVEGTLNASNMIVADSSGALCKAYNAIGSFFFPIGDVTDEADYSPTTLNFTSGTFSSGQACVRVTDSKLGANSSITDYLTRYWTVTSSGITNFTCATRFDYASSGDIVGDSTKIYPLKYNNEGVCTQSGSVNDFYQGSNYFLMTVSSFSDITGGNGPTAITLAAFDAAPQGDAIRVTWETAAELDNLGFHLYRSAFATGPWTRLNATLIPPQFPGQVYGGFYEWLDTDVLPGATYYYRLEDVDIYGVRTFHGPVWAVLGGARWKVYLPLVQHAPLAVPTALSKAR